MPSVAEYKADVERRGGYYFAALPASVPGAGKVGARFPAYSASRQYTFEVAPASVQVAAGGSSFLSSILDGVTVYAANNPAGVTTWEEDLAAFKTGVKNGVKAVELPSLLDILAKMLGVPKPVIILLLAFVGYSMLRNAGVVPPLKSVVT